MKKNQEKRLVALGALLLLAGCATEAQQMAGRHQAVARQTMSISEQCISNLRDDPRYTAITAALMPPAGASAPTLEQQANNRKPTAEQRALIVTWHGDLSACRRIMLEGMSATNTTIAGHQVTFYREADETYLALVRGDITYGEANRRLIHANDVRRQRIADAERAMGQALHQAHQAELAQRRVAADRLAAAGQRLAASSYAAQQEQFNQQMLHALNRPPRVRSTHCTRVGDTVHCSSY